MKKQTAGDAPLSLEARLIKTALHRIAHVLRPYPEDCTPEALTEALAALRTQGLIHGPAREPNLTAKAVEMLRENVDEVA